MTGVLDDVSRNKSRRGDLMEQSDAQVYNVRGGRAPFAGGWGRGSLTK